MKYEWMESYVASHQARATSPTEECKALVGGFTVAVGVVTTDFTGEAGVGVARVMIDVRIKCT